MFSEQLVVMLVLAAAQVHAPQNGMPTPPVPQDARQAVIQAVKEPELVAALSLRAKRLEAHKHKAIVSQTMLASVR